MADSIIFNPHKSLFQPVGSGGVIFRTRPPMKDPTTHSDNHDNVNQPITNSCHIENGHVPPATFHKALEYRSPARAFPIWFSINLIGLQSFTNQAEEKLLLCEYMYHRLQIVPEVALGPKPNTAVLTFRCTGGGTTAEDNAHTDELLKDVLEDGMFVVNSCAMDGYAYIRVCTTNFRAHLSDVDMLLADIEAKVQDASHYVAWLA